MSNIDLQECGKLLNVPLGKDISTYILPAIKKMSEFAAQYEERVKELEEVLSIVLGSFALERVERFDIIDKIKTVLNSPVQ